MLERCADGRPGATDGLAGRRGRRSVWGALLASLSLGPLGACGPDGPGPDLDPDAGDGEPDWPDPPSIPPACTPAMAFADPALAPPSGTVSIGLSARLQPVGVTVRLDLTVLDDQTSEVDASATGAIALDLDPAGEVVEISDIEAGRARATVRFDAPGAVSLTATLADDDRSGTNEVLAYEPRLPVWELAIDPEDWGALSSGAYENTKWPCSLRAEGRDHTGTIRLHGGSSREYPKKSFRIDLDEGEELEGGSPHLILRAEWNDKTLLRNWLALRLVRETTWIPTPDAELVHLRVDGALYGLMLRVERVDGDFAVRHGVASAASLFSADQEIAWVPPGANLTPLDDREGYPHVYPQRLGVAGYEDLVTLVEDTLQRPDDDLAATLADEVAIDDALAYFAAMAVLQNHDHIRKNYLLVRDPWSGDGRWRVWPWDLDLTLGHLWTEEGDLLDEQIFSDESPLFGERVAEHDFYNQLLTRLLGVPRWRSRFVGFVHRIADAGLPVGVIDGWIDEALCAATPELLADERKRSSNDEYLDRVDEIRGFVADRRAFLAGWEGP